MIKCSKRDTLHVCYVFNEHLAASQLYHLLKLSYVSLQIIRAAGTHRSECMLCCCCAVFSGGAEFSG